jgi:primary-amine oxidase
MRFRILAFGLAALAVLAVTSVVGATPVTALRGHTVASIDATTVAGHPLDPLTADEIQRTFTTIENARNLAPATFLPIVKLSEPPKSFMQGWSPGQPFPRKAFANVFDRSANTLYEAVVDLSANTLDSWTQKAGAQPAVYFAEWEAADALVRAYAPWKKAIRDRGLDPKDVYVDTWAGPDTSAAAPVGTRILKALSFYRGALPNPYDRSIEGVVVTMDMNKLKVVDFVDSGSRPVDTTTSGNSRTPRTDLKPLVVQQPEGPSFTLLGRDVSWQGWHFRVDWSPREGLVLDRVGFEQNGAVRPVLNRMSLSEIYVPYAIPDANWSWRSAFDVGEYNLGLYSEGMEANIDVPENAVFFDEVAGDTGSAGGSYEIPHGVAMYERDAGSLWDRLDPTTIERDARYARELVVTWAAAIGNYTYGVEYVFKLNGAIDVNVNATGTTLNQGIRSSSEGNQHGTVVTPQIAAPGHQHFFNFRIDFDVDGTLNRVVEENVASTAAPGGNAWTVQETELGTEGFRDANPAATRSWRIESTTKANAVGEPTAYELVGSNTGVPYSSPTYPPLLQAPFAQHPLWVTKYQDGERYAAGDYPFQGAAGDGLTAYASPAENLDGQDVVVWYTPAFTHVPHVEDYPVMTTESADFHIEPDGFFDSNPALDAPNQ